MGIPHDYGKLHLFLDRENSTGHLAYDMLRQMELERIQSYCVQQQVAKGKKQRCHQLTVGGFPGTQT